MRRKILAAATLAATMALIPAAGLRALDAQVLREAEPKKAPKLELPPVEEARKAMEEARTVKGVALPVGDILSKTAGTIDGTTISFDELLDEVMVRFGSAYVQPLVNQAVMELVVRKRGAEVTDAELLEEVRHSLAQSKGKGSLKEQLERSRMGWDRFEQSLRTRAAINKIVKADQNIEDPGPPNQFLMQVWFGGIRNQYKIEMAAEKLPKNCFGEVVTHCDAAQFLRELRLATEQGRAYSITEAPGEGGDDATGHLVLTPAGGGWPRFYVPNVPAQVVRNGRITPVPLVSLLPEFAAGNATAERKVLCRAGGSVTPVALLPAVKVQKVEKDKPAEVSLTEALASLTKGGHAVNVEANEIRPTGEGAVYRLPAKMLTSYQAPFRQTLAAAVAKLAGSTFAAEEAVVGMSDGDDGLIIFPTNPIEFKSRVDRAKVLSFAFGSLKLAQFDDAMRSLCRFKAVKRAFAGYAPGKPGAEKAPWGTITVNEAAVEKRIAAERAKYDGTIFPWHMICSILGKTVPEEMRRFWVGNGVDQVIGTEVTDEELKAYYDKHIAHFGVATAEAEHILIAMKDPSTGRVQWDAAKKKAEEIVAMIKTGAEFGSLARQFSEDPQTKDKGGDLGLFTLVSRYNYDLCKAAFAMEPGQISGPVKSKLGYHVIRLRKKSPPDLVKYGWDSKDMKERVREYRQDMLQEDWLEENVYSKFKSTNNLEEIIK